MTIPTHPTEGAALELLKNIDRLSKLTKKELDSISEVSYDPHTKTFCLIADAVENATGRFGNTRRWMIHGLNTHQAEDHLRKVELFHNCPFFRDIPEWAGSERYVRHDTQLDHEVALEFDIDADWLPIDQQGNLVLRTA